MLPIETGCLAIVINSEAGNNGVCLTVGKYIGFNRPDKDRDIWEVDKKLNKLNIKTGKMSKSRNTCSESKLLRIDGGEFEEEKELAEIKL